jgi:hypothetical protein
MQSGFEHVSLNADFAFGCDDSAGRHSASKIAPLFYCDLTRAHVHEDASDERDEQEQGDYAYRQSREHGTQV